MPLIVPLAAAFFVAALLYASVGFGGGSTYAALLALAGVDYRLLPLIALTCNIVVVAGASVRFAKGRVTPWRGALGLTAIAAPAAFVGGLAPLPEDTFMTLLGTSLVLTGLTMLWPLSVVPSGDDEAVKPSKLARAIPFAAAPLGLVAGMVGIGGGIFLAPLLHLARWRDARAIAATASFFILVNSLFGLAGQLVKTGASAFGGAMAQGLPLLLAVAVGGQIGSLLAIRVLPLRWLRWLTALLVLMIGVRLLLR
ncbi:MAG: sulfite exporter TauE/SafE family protein [Erythrobacter sp.]